MKKLIITIMMISGILAAETLDFETAVNIALENNLSIKMSENALQMTKNYVNRGVLMPTFSLNGSSTYTNTDQNSGSDYDAHVNYGYLSTSYTLFSGFYVLNNYKKFKLEYSQSELETRYTVESIIAAMAQTYYSVANAKDQLALAKETLQISGDRLRRIREQENLGKINKVELLSAEVDYNRDSITVESTKLSYENSLRDLNVMLNREVNAEYDIDSSVEMVSLPNYEDLKKSAFKSNAEYQADLCGINVAEMDVKIASSQYMPTLNLTGSYGLTQTNYDFDPSLSAADNYYSVGLTFSFSIFDGFQRKIQRQNAKISLDNQKLTVEQAKLNLENDLANQYTTYLNSQKTLEMEKLNLQATQSNFDRTRELYELGQVTSVQFREAQLNLRQAKSNISSGKYTVKLNEIFLLQLAGMLLD